MLEAIMRANIVMLAVLAGLGLSVPATAKAEAKNLSCISGIAPNEQRLLRDCEPKPEPILYAIEVLNEVPPPSTPPVARKNGESGKGRGADGNAGRDHDAPNGGGGTAGAAAN
jgi:hypothetical protein